MAGLAAFEVYRAQFDAFNERRERLILSSRQITSLSKKLIFHLHRISLIPSASLSSSSPEQLAARGQAVETLFGEADVKLDEIRGWLIKVGLELRASEREARGTDGSSSSEAGPSTGPAIAAGGSGTGVGGYWAFARNVSPGIQEFLESLSFLHFLRTGGLVSLEEVREWMKLSRKDLLGGGSFEGEGGVVEGMVEGKEIFVITPEEYAMGVSDLTGELMRYATNCQYGPIGSSSGDFETAIRVCAFVRDMKSGLDTAEPFVRDLSKKQAVTMQSLEKIEKICYAIQLRVMEYADRPDVLSHLTKRALEDQEQDSQGDESGHGGGPGGGVDRGDAGGRGRGAPRGGRGRGGSRGGGGGGRGGASRTTAMEERPAKRQAVEVQTT